MNIKPISNITKKVLPLAAATAIGLGTFASCSSSKEDLPSNSDFYKTEILKLDNTLDSLKSARGEGELEFLDYYVKSRDILDNAELSQTETKESKKMNNLFLYGLVSTLLLGFGTMVSAILVSIRDTKARMGTFIGLTLSAMVGLGLTTISHFASSTMRSEIHRNFNEHKSKKLNDLEMEKQHYIGAKSAEIGIAK